ncbi:MAG: hypothetical protein LQ341_003707 [Variospora aurantia]|nr:MAG: hypothetical protein LQ341_003707 [Variospora aurantia]
MEPEQIDVAVIGAGISGIAAAKFYLDVHSDCKLLILERDRSVGGVWNSERVYDTFYTQSPFGTWEFSDMAMPRPPEADMYNASFKAKYTSQYLESFVDSCVYAGKKLRERIRCGFDVQEITKRDDVWIISGHDQKGVPRKLKSPKLVVASGLTSVPNMPFLLGQGKFQNPVVHQKDFGKSDVLSSSAVMRVTVLGAAKSAADLVYDCAKAGKAVTWIIRRTGTGPGVFVPSPSARSASASYSVGTLRVFATLTPSLFNSQSWWDRFLQRSPIGQRLLTKTWNDLERKVLRDGSFDNRGEVAKRNGFEKLKPHSPIFWQNQGAGLINRPDFWDTIATKVRVVQQDIGQVDKGVIRLKDGQEIPADAILCGTGWVPSLNFFSHDQLAKLGLPQPIGTYPIEEADMWTSLEQEADRVVLDRFPMLANPPEHYREPVTHTPYRLYNSIGPLQDHSIVFVGHAMIANYFHLAECQAIWATAYLDGKIELPPLEERRKTVALFVAWCRRRYLSNGDRGHWLASEQRTYTDRLFDQLGLSSHRRFWLWDSFTPISKNDLPRLRAEYIKRYGQDSPPIAHRGPATRNNAGSVSRRLVWNWNWRNVSKISPQLRRIQGRGSLRNICTSSTFLQRSTSNFPPFSSARSQKHAETLFRSVELFARCAR